MYYHDVRKHYDEIIKPYEEVLKQYAGRLKRYEEIIKQTKQIQRILQLSCLPVGCTIVDRIYAYTRTN
jgi:hypothetical protein